MAFSYLRRRFHRMLIMDRRTLFMRIIMASLASYVFYIGVVCPMTDCQGFKVDHKPNQSPNTNESKYPQIYRLLDKLLQEHGDLGNVLKQTGPEIEIVRKFLNAEDVHNSNSSRQKRENEETHSKDENSRHPVFSNNELAGRDVLKNEDEIVNRNGHVDQLANDLSDRKKSARDAWKSWGKSITFKKERNTRSISDMLSSLNRTARDEIKSNKTGKTGVEMNFRSKDDEQLIQVGDRMKKRKDEKVTEGKSGVAIGAGKSGVAIGAGKDKHDNAGIFRSGKEARMEKRGGLFLRKDGTQNGKPGEGKSGLSGKSGKSGKEEGGKKSVLKNKGKIKAGRSERKNRAKKAREKTDKLVRKGMGKKSIIPDLKLISNLTDYGKIGRKKKMSKAAVGPSIKLKPNNGTQPIAYSPNRQPMSKHIEHPHKVYEALEKAGFEVKINYTENWHLMWSDFDPIRMGRWTPDELKPLQKVNIVPGLEPIVSKVRLVTEDNVGSIPPAFSLPNETQKYLDYVKVHTDTMWVQKNKKHRGVMIKKPEEMDFSAGETFIQEFVARPYLVANRKFDVGVFVGVTSVNPLRMHVWTGEWLLKFCMEEYYPFDPKNTRKYVEEEFLKTVEMPELRDLRLKGLSRRETLLTYITGKGQNPSHIAQSLEDAVTELAFAKEASISKMAQHWKIKDYRPYFELLRMDTVLDDSLKTWIIEVNRSPYIRPPGNLPRNQTEYLREMLTELFYLAGTVNYHTRKIKQLVKSDEILIEDPQLCRSQQCTSGCGRLDCALCSHCLTDLDQDILREAVEEHRNRARWVRVFPPPFKDQQDALRWTTTRDPRFLSLSRPTQVQWLWYRKKCILDQTWCSK